MAPLHRALSFFDFDCWPRIPSVGCIILLHIRQTSARQDVCLSGTVSIFPCGMCRLELNTSYAGGDVCLLCCPTCIPVSLIVSCSIPLQISLFLGWSKPVSWDRECAVRLGITLSYTQHYSVFALSSRFLRHPPYPNECNIQWHTSACWVPYLFVGGKIPFIVGEGMPV